MSKHTPEPDLAWSPQVLVVMHPVAGRLPLDSYPLEIHPGCQHLAAGGILRWGIAQTLFRQIDLACRGGDCVPPKLEGSRFLEESSCSTSWQVQSSVLSKRLPTNSSSLPTSMGSKEEGLH